MSQSINSNTNAFRYIPIGDSYTIGLGVGETDRWPNILVEQLKINGINLELVTNPAVSGFTVNDAIEYQLPQVEKHTPDVVTVLIGANDNFRQISVQEFSKSFNLFLDRLQKTVTNSRHILLITIPDHTRSPAGRAFGEDANRQLLEEYNSIIKEQAIKRGMSVVDLFPVSQTMTDEDFIADGLHPSAKGYTKWERVIYKTMFDILSK